MNIRKRTVSSKSRVSLKVRWFWKPNVTEVPDLYRQQNDIDRKKGKLNRFAVKIYPIFIFHNCTALSTHILLFKCRIKHTYAYIDQIGLRWAFEVTLFKQNSLRFDSAATPIHVSKAITHQPNWRSHSISCANVHSILSVWILKHNANCNKLCICNDCFFFLNFIFDLAAFFIRSVFFGIHFD